MNATDQEVTAVEAVKLNPRLGTVENLPPDERDPEPPDQEVGRDKNDQNKKNVNLYSVPDATQGVELRKESVLTVQGSSPRGTAASQMYTKPKT